MWQGFFYFIIKGFVKGVFDVDGNLIVVYLWVFG